jgi:hypothetical protein
MKRLNAFLTAAAKETPASHSVPVELLIGSTWQRPCCSGRGASP